MQDHQQRNSLRDFVYAPILSNRYGYANLVAGLWAALVIFLVALGTDVVDTGVVADPLTGEVSRPDLTYHYLSGAAFLVGTIVGAIAYWRTMYRSSLLVLVATICLGALTMNQASDQFDDGETLIDWLALPAAPLLVSGLLTAIAYYRWRARLRKFRKA